MQLLVSIVTATASSIQTKTKFATKMKSQAAKTILLATTTQQRRTRATATYPEANYDCDGNCLNDSDQDGICDALEADGCTDSSACNYDSDASDDDDASCTYATAGFDCDGNCLIDSDNDGICDQNEILGCTDPNAEAFSFQPLATEDDGSCIYCNVEIQLDVVTGDYNESGNGYAGVSIIYGYPPFSYYWIGPAGFESNDEDIFGLSSGNYTLYA